MSNANRLFFVMLATIILIGIAFTGFDVVCWFLYVPVLGLYGAAAFGICPGMMLAEMICDKLDI